MNNTYTILFMSSGQNLVRQLSIKRWVVLFVGLFLCLTFSLIIYFAVSGMKHSIRYRAELQGEVASREELKNTIKKYAEEHQAIQEELQDFRKMNKAVRKYLGIGSVGGLLGQGGGGFNAEAVDDGESIERVVETQPTPIPSHTESPKGDLADLITQVRKELIPIYERVEERAAELYETPSILPILVPEDDDSSSYWYSSGFGYRPHPLTGKTQFHNGLDVATSLGTPVIATADGFISEIGEDLFFGNMVQIEHPGPQMRTLYGHLKNYADGLEIGQKVKRSEIIGYVGSSGRSTGAHLHYGVYTDGKWQDPRKHIIFDDPLY